MSEKRLKFGNIRVPKENVHYACIACITIASVMRMVKKNYPQIYFRRVQLQTEKNKDVQIHKH